MVTVGGTALPVYDLAAIGFQIPLPPSLIQSGSFVVEVDSGWICPDAQCIVFSDANEISGVAAVSVARIDGSGPDGQGILARIRFIISGSYVGSPVIPIGVDTYQAYEPGSSPIPLTTNGAQITFPITGLPSSETVEGLSLYPNPANTQAMLVFRYNGIEEPNVNLQIMDLSGRLLIERRIAIRPGSNSLPLDTKSLSHGVYLVRLIGPGIAVARRLVKAGQ